jgi:hypothetical protein
MSDKYILKGHETVPCDNLFEWAAWFEIADRRVVETEKNGIRVSTVFLGLDHSFGRGKPLLFETMIFGGEHDSYQDRYETWDEAEAGHRIACEFAFENMKCIACESKEEEIPTDRRIKLRE